MEIEWFKVQKFGIFDQIAGIQQYKNMIYVIFNYGWCRRN